MTAVRAFRTCAFAKRLSVEDVEEGELLAPKFDRRGLIPVVTTDAKTGDVLMMGVMNAEALVRTIESGEAHYWSRSRKQLWRKGVTSGFVQKVVELRIDDDRDAIWLRVEVAGHGGSCHVGYRSCFYRTVPIGALGDGPVPLRFVETQKLFDPRDIYADAPNPTRL
jgi:phosphoribosyl-AMP cyclohydrolase